MGCGASNVPDRNRNIPNIQIQRQVVRTRNTTNQRFRALELPSPYKYGRMIQKDELDRLREEYWSTRVEGNGIMWQALRSASEALIIGDLSLANAIIEASNIGTPNGSLELCYDELGQQYNIPQYCFTTPLELTNQLSTSSKKLSIKGIINVENSKDIKIRVRVNPGDINAVFDISTGDTILDLKKVLYDHSVQSNGKIPICEDYRQRVMFMGKELLNGQTIQSAGVDESRVVQIFVKPQKNTGTSTKSN
mmetsp:Transcript_7906/g.7065  ORF Transcript_7906/g.7065 Transcript_7906/m.7065 type:complete len:250 (-) Transcript_7906:125-874(-)